MKFVDVVVALYALLSIAMGVLGYVAPTTGHPSIISLIAGVAIGGFLLGFLALTKTNARVGRIGSAVVTLVPIMKFAKPFLSEHKIYPAGIMVICGLITFAVLGGGHMAAMAKRKREA